LHFEITYIELIIDRTGRENIGRSSLYLLSLVITYTVFFFQPPIWWTLTYFPQVN